MTRQETGQIMDLLATAYPKFYSGQGAPDPAKTLNLWATMFAEDPKELVTAAVKALIATDEKGFPPHIGAVKGYMRRIAEPEPLTEGAAWASVWQAVRNSAYHAQREFDRLPPEVQRSVGGPETLKAWSQLPADEVQTVIASNFQRSFRAKQQTQREFAALPPDVKALAGTLSGRMALEEKHDF